ncbi:sucrose nonfermenting 4-like protein [Vigna radiata var. radiata]|uniref:Sucrose nonfermenting 4-like protein n=1 Tax=Vigna radiata var. radiata TaxID=3916 RepID=A0A1S3U7C6_VIGRR|nr:sucrose nonfermenting 4-like protein [Vigna radiata var. radiata]XP_014501911.1 sucrose nonfermenting 4-like protein [Vigna radiata var. radiata]
MDPGRDAGGVAGTVLIPMRFVWPYGGRSVFLCGSFTRWSELLPMSPVEGCPTVFQVIYNLPPGYHQYKFFVDGEWRHDEHQPYVPGEYGMVNTVFLATDPNYIPVLNSDVAPGNSMDVDNEAFRRVVRVRLTDGSEVLPRISEADVQISRQRISAFLSSHTAYELLPESGKVVALDVDLPVKQAFHILHEQGIFMAPLWDFCKGQFVGVLSALDFILILRELGNHGSNLTEEELETHSISAWKEGKSYLNRQNNGHGAVFSRRFIHSGPYDNLKDIAVKILQKEVSTVPVIHCSSEHASFPQLLHLASLSGILKCICRYFRHCSSSLPALQFPICAIPVGTWVPKIGESNRRPLAMLRPTASLASALNLLVQAQVSSIPIVDDNDSLLDIYCRSDITALAKNRAYTHINLDEMTVHQALQLGQDAYSPYELRSQRCQMCLRSDSLHKVMERLANPGVRRLVIVEAGSKRVEGIVSLSDIFKFFLGG